MSDVATIIERLVSKAGQPYTLPAVAVKVLELTNNPQVDARALKRCLENDPALTGKILRVVNSSLFGLSRQVSDLSQALALLGTKPLKMLVLGFSLPPGLFAGLESNVLVHYWRHTLVKAVAAREMCERFVPAPGEDAFVAALLQDIGMLLLIQELGEPYVKFLKRVLAEEQDLLTMESEVMGFDHTMLSARLLAQWGLPAAIVAAVGWRPASGQSYVAAAREAPLVRVVFLAELIARLLADQHPAVLVQLLAAGRAWQWFTEKALEELITSLEGMVQQLAEVLKLHLPGGLDYRDILAQAHAQLATVAAEAATEMLSNHSGGERLGEGKSDREDRELLALAVGRLRRTGLPSNVTPSATSSLVATCPSQMDTNPTVSSCVEAGRGEVASPSGTAVSHSPAAPRQYLEEASSPLCHAASAEGAAQTNTEQIHRQLIAHLGMAATACRQTRSPLSLMLVELKYAAAPAAKRIASELGDLQRLVARLCDGVEHPLKLCLPCGPQGYALVLPRCERHEAVASGNQLLSQFRHLTSQANGSNRLAMHLGIGIATVALPPKNFLPQNLLAGASRCLYASHASGGGVVKSIEIY